MLGFASSSGIATFDEFHKHNTALRSGISRVNLARVRMNAVGGVGGGFGGGRKNSIPFSRLGEFAFSGGDRDVQTDLAREAMQRVAQATSADYIEGKIRQFDSDVPQMISRMW